MFWVFEQRFCESFHAFVNSDIGGNTRQARNGDKNILPATRHKGKCQDTHLRALGCRVRLEILLFPDRLDSNPLPTGANLLSGTQGRCEQQKEKNTGVSTILTPPLACYHCRFHHGQQLGFPKHPHLI